MIASRLGTSSSLRAPFKGASRVASTVPARLRLPNPCRATHKVEIEHEGKVHVLNVRDGESILSVALDKGLDLPHDCKLGVCMTCPAKLVSGHVANGTALLTAGVAAAGYTLLCMAEPTTDCRIRTISEDELLDLQLDSSQ